MKILLTNDDGVFAPGIKVLHQYLKDDHEVTVIAPLEEKSTTGHTLSLDRPLRLEKIEPDIYGCSGFPADCVFLALQYLSQKPFDLVISGINRGPNLGQDVYYSGTVAGAREAAFHNLKSIAVSTALDDWQEHKIKTNVIFYETAAQAIKKIIAANLPECLGNKELYNVNVPNISTSDIKGMQLTQLGFRNYSKGILARKDHRQKDYFWLGGIYKDYDPIENSDCLAIDQNHISISLLQHGGHSRGDSAEIKRRLQTAAKEFSK